MFHNSFIVVRYPHKETAEAALEVANQLVKEKVVKLKDAVALTKDEKGKLHMHQTKDDPAGRRFLKGGVIGIIFAVQPGSSRERPWARRLPCSTGASRTSCLSSWAKR